MDVWVCVCELCNELCVSPDFGTRDLDASICVCAGGSGKWYCSDSRSLECSLQFHTRTYGGVRTIDLYFEWIKNGFMFSNLEKWKYTTCMWKWMVVVCARSMLCFVESLNFICTHTHIVAHAANAWDHATISQFQAVSLPIEVRDRVLAIRCCIFSER